jgi:hypothetical protein
MHFIYISNCTFIVKYSASMLYLLLRLQMIHARMEDNYDPCNGYRYI